MTVADLWRVEWCGPFDPKSFDAEKATKEPMEATGPFDPIHLGDDSAFVTPRLERRTHHEAAPWRLPAQTVDLR